MILEERSKLVTAGEFTAATPVPGHVLDNGAIVIAYEHVWDGGEGLLPNGIVLAIYHAGYRHQEFVTWRCYLSENDGKWYCEVGSYQMSIIDAVADYERRGGK